MGSVKARTRRLRVTVAPTKGWLHPLDRALDEAPGVGREAFHGVRQLADETVITLAEVTGPLEHIETACRDTDGVVSHTVSPLDDGWLVFAWIESTPVVERMLRLRRQTGILAEPPFEWTDRGELRLDVVGTADTIRGVADLDDGLDVSVDPVDGAACHGLSPDHVSAVETAVDLGYYDVTRDATVDDVAAAVDAPRPRTERRLREAECRLFSQVLADH